jgi:N-acetylmuramoyl-L-alanine amidase
MSRSFSKAALAGLLGIVLAGCDHPIQIDEERVPVPEGTVSVYGLAGRLGMRVDQSGRSLACLAGPFDRILVLGSPGSQVYVNGRAVGPQGQVRAVEDLLFVPLALEPEIRAALRGPITRREERPFRPPSTGGLVPVEPPRPARGLVVLDAGHGGDDPGAMRGGIVEKDLNLALVQMVAECLKARGVQVILTRSDNTFIKLPDRPEFANRAGADLFLSIHANSTADSGISGFQVYVSDSPSQASIAAALAIARRLNQAGIWNYGTEPHRKPYQVLIHSRRPAVLLEVGFLTNASEAARLRQGSYQHKLADSVAEGVADFLRSR